MFNSDLFILFCELFARVCFGLGPGCSGLKTYMNWFYWTDTTGTLVYLEEQNTKDSHTSQRQELESQPPPLILTLLLFFTSCISLSSRPLCSPITLYSIWLWLATVTQFRLSFNLTLQFRYPSSSECLGYLCPRFLGVSNRLAQFHSVFSQQRSGQGLRYLGPVLSRHCG